MLFASIPVVTSTSELLHCFLTTTSDISNASCWRYSLICPFNPFNPLKPNSDLSQTSHCNIKGVSVSEVMRISENMITQAQFY